MLMKNLTRIDRFYAVVIVVLFLLTLLIIFTLKGVLSSVITMNEIDEEVIGSISLVNEVQLKKATDYVVKKDIKPLDLKE